jgi:hypothetical protein
MAFWLFDNLFQEVKLASGPGEPKKRIGWEMKHPAIFAWSKNK